MRTARPDPAARALSRLLVGVVVTSVVGKKTGLIWGALAAAASVAAHEQFDAPVAKMLTNIGV